METVIQTLGLSKIYGDINAVSELNLSVNKGEIFGFLGLNGAGKTTTIRMLLGMINATSGSSKILGQRVYPNNTKLWSKIGYLVETPHSYPNLTVRENLEIIRKLRFIDDKKSVDIIINKLGLERYANRKAKYLSLGNYQRLGLAKAMIHNPELLILDEPTNSLDPSGIHEVREMLIDLAKNSGVTIFISSHILSEIAKIATRIGIIHQGFLIEEFETKELNYRCKKQLIVKTKNLKQSVEILKEKAQVELQDEQIILTDENSIQNPEKIAELLVKSGNEITHLQVCEEDLESYFLRTIKSKEEQK